MLIDTLSVIGVGLIGGSLARALKHAHQCRHIIGCGRQRENLEKALQLGVIDEWHTDISTAVASADVVMVAVPLGAMATTFNAMRGALKNGAIITDGGSAKASVLDAARTHLGAHFPNFVPGHPIAGAENSGVSASRADLYVDHRVILTPVAETHSAALERIEEMWRYTGAHVMRMDVDKHDKVLAATSHLPHMLAFSFVDLLAHLPTEDKVFEFAAGGFRDFSRIASSDTQMWHDIALANREAIITMLQYYQENLSHLMSAIQNNDSEHIKSVFARAKATRDEVFSDPK
jgi:prephenate dehydrogenase